MLRAGLFVTSPVMPPAPRRLAGFAIYLIAMIASSAKAELPSPTFADVAYGEHERHRLDLWQAAGDGRKPLLIFIHGGGWAGGDKRDVPEKLLRLMLSKGVSVASLNYRYTSMAMLPGPQRDAARAVQFLRSKAADWHLNSERFAAYGISAGGCSALWLAYHDDLAEKTNPSDAIARESTRLCAAVGLSPQTCLEPAVVKEWIGEQVLAHPMMARAVQAKKLTDLEMPKPEWVELLREASPINHVSRDDPPVLISNPKVDALPATSAGSAIHHAIFGEKLKEQCDAAGAVCILRIESNPNGQPTPEEFLIQQLFRP